MADLNEIKTQAFEANAVAQLISSLLGQPRTIEKTYRHARFEIDHDWILHLLAAITQRVEQNKAVNYSFSAKIYFKDGKTVTVSDKGSFEVFRNSSLSETLGIDIKIAYLVTFDKKPEKQEIRLQFFSDILAKYFSNESEERTRIPAIELEIDHTNVTWGEDVFGVIDNEIRNVSDKDVFPKFLDKLTNEGLPWFILFGLTFCLLRIGFIFTKSSEITANKILEINKALPRDSLALVSAKLDVILNRLTIENISQVMWVAVSLIIFATISIAIKKLYLKFYKSFVILNDYTKKICDSHKKKRNGIKNGIIATFTLGVLASCVAYFITKGA